MKKGIGKSHSKIILIGEHSVVYGYSAIALPLKNIEVVCEVVKYSDKKEYIGLLKKGYKKYIFNSKDVLSIAIYTALQYVNEPNQKIAYKITSSIPARRGMGSSAAVSIAVIRAIIDLFGIDNKKKLINIKKLVHYDKKMIEKTVNESVVDSENDVVDDKNIIDKKIYIEELEKLVNKTEKVAHNNPSGLDAKTCLSDKPIKFLKNKGFEYINIDLGAYLVIADTGIYGCTSEAVEKVKLQGEKAKIHLEKLGNIAIEIEKNIKNKDIISIGQNMNIAHTTLKNLGVSIDKVDILVETAQKSGAVGAKMSGGGLGGCIIALAQNMDIVKNIKDKLIEKGAVNIWIEKL